jgi:exopolysaccharide biosynthesis predicted pyruvyltransferase EpsI
MDLPGFLQSLQGKKIFFDRLHGNHGDRLLTLAALSLMEDAALNLVEDAQSADFIILNGGGSMVDGWFGLQRLSAYCSRFPDKPLAVLPSSFYLPRSDLVDVIRKRQAPLWLWAREKPSLAVLQSAGLGDLVTLGIDHDLAFFLKHHPVIESLKTSVVPFSVLVVERDDWEGPTGRRRVLSPAGFEFIPERLRTLVRRHVLGPIRKRQDQVSSFRGSALQYLQKQHTGIRGMETFVGDISLPETCDFEDFLQHVARSEFIVTTRLHVAILGQLLNRTTYLVDGSYHKFRGVFNYSMSNAGCGLLVWNPRQLQLEECQAEC